MPKEMEPSWCSESLRASSPSFPHTRPGPEPRRRHQSLSCPLPPRASTICKVPAVLSWIPLPSHQNPRATQGREENKVGSCGSPVRRQRQWQWRQQQRPWSGPTLLEEGECDGGDEQEEGLDGGKVGRLVSKDVDQLQQSRGCWSAEALAHQDRPASLECRRGLLPEQPLLHPPAQSLGQISAWDEGPPVE